MLHDVHELLDAVAVRVPAALVSEQSLERLRALRHGPRAFGWAGLECRLAGPADRVDFMCCVDGREAQREAILNAEDVPPVVRAWGDPASEVGRRCPYLWLEYDVPVDAGPCEPLVFLKLGSHLHRPSVQEVADAVAALGGPCAANARLECAIEALGRSGRVVHVTWLGPRGVFAPRIITSQPRKQMRAWLRAIEWAGDIDRLSRVADALCSWSSHATVAVDLGEWRDDVAGLEVSLPTSATRDPRWRSVFEYLAANDLCSRDRAAAAENWKDGADETMDRDLQIKVTVRGARLDAKAYLAFRPRGGHGSLTAGEELGAGPSGLAG